MSHVGRRQPQLTPIGVPGERRLATGQVEGGECADCVRMAVEALQELGGLLQAALPQAQVREADEPNGTPLRHATVEVPGGLDELSLRLIPASGSGQDAAVVGAAERGDDVAALHELCGRASIGPRAGRH